MGCFTPKHLELDQQVMEWFSRQRGEGKYYICYQKSGEFCRVSGIIFQCMGSKYSDWSKICCCHDNSLTCHKSAVVTESQNGGFVIILAIRSGIKALHRSVKQLL